jgi:hypothetical protein
LAAETGVFGENQPQCHYVHHKTYMLRPDANPGRRSGELVTNRLSYGTALLLLPLPLLLTFFIVYKVGTTPCRRDRAVGRPLPTPDNRNTEVTQTSIPRLEFEPTIPAFKRAKTFHSLHCAATVISKPFLYPSHAEHKVACQ